MKWKKFHGNYKTGTYVDIPSVTSIPNRKFICDYEDLTLLHMHTAISTYPAVTIFFNLNSSLISSILAEHNSVYKQNFVTYPKINFYQITVNSKLDKLDYFKVVDKLL